MNDIAYRQPSLQTDRTLEQPIPAQTAGAVPINEDTIQRIAAEVRRELRQDVEWEVQRRLAARHVPAPTEAVLMLGSLVAGVAVTAILVANATTITSGFLGTQSASHLNTLPLVVVIWLALFAINLIWARRR